jgi:Bax protein
MGDKRRSKWIPVLAALSLLVGLAAFWGGCGEGPPEGEKHTLRGVLQQVKLPPLEGELPEKGEGAARGGTLPELDELESRAPGLSELNPELPDFSRFLDVQEKKRRFFEFMSDLLRAENARIRRERYRLVKLYRDFQRGEALSGEDRAWLQSLARKYREPFGKEANAGLFRNLLVKVDIVPLELGMAQAANESAWGTSRFARKGNNLFGQWCYEEGCGLVPLRRSPGSTHEVQSYASPRLSVRDYMRNLNSHPAYSEFRQIRYRQRRSGSGLKGSELAEGLLAYSGIGHEYVSRLRSIMEQYMAYRAKAEAESGSKQG